MSLGGVIELCERVVLLHEAQFLLYHLLGQPFVAIDVDLDSERQPGLQAHMDQAELRIKEVIIEDSLLPGSADELGPFGARHECEGRTSFLSAEDTNESLGDALIADEVVGPLVLAELPCAIHVGSAGLPAQPWACATKRSEYWGAMVFMKSLRRTFRTRSTKYSSSRGADTARCPLKMTRSKQ